MTEKKGIIYEKRIWAYYQHINKKGFKKEIEERKEKVRKLLAKRIAQEIFRRNGLEIDMDEVELWYASQQGDCRPKTSKHKKRL